jgi:GAF domain-containing protein
MQRQTDLPQARSARAAWSVRMNLTTQPLDDDDSVLREFSRILDAAGAREALAFLGSRSTYRFIAVFRFKEGRSTAALFVDRDNPHVRSTAEVPETATYCCHVRDGRAIFETADAMDDPRLTTHAARQAIRAYHGIPIMTPEGELIGTLCHYDVEPRDPTQLSLELLLQVGNLLQRGNHIPPYPTFDPAGAAQAA